MASFSSLHTLWVSESRMLTHIFSREPAEHSMLCHKMLGFGIEPRLSTRLLMPTNVSLSYGRRVARQEQRMREVAVASSSLERGISEEAPASAAAEGEVEMDSAVFEGEFRSVEKRVSRSRWVQGPQSSLIPDDWKGEQQYFQRSKKERKQERLDLQKELARRKAAQKRATQREIAIQDAKEGSEKRQRLLRGQELLSVDDVASTSAENVDEWQEEEEEQDFASRFREPDEVNFGKILPKDNRRQLEFSTLDEDIASILREEEGQFDGVRTEHSRESDAEEDFHSSEESESFSLTAEEKAMRKGKHLNFVKSSSGAWSSLHTLAASGQVYLVAKLLEKGAAVDEVDRNGFTPLHRAVQSGRKTMLRLLLKAGANPLVLDDVGASLVHYCARVGSPELTKLVLRYGVDVNRADKDGWTPLHVAVQSGKLELIKTLVYRGADVHIANKDGNTALDLALAFSGCFNFYDAIKFLKKRSVLDAGGSLNNKDYDEPNEL